MLPWQLTLGLFPQENTGINLKKEERLSGITEKAEEAGYRGNIEL